MGGVRRDSVFNGVPSAVFNVPMPMMAARAHVLRFRENSPNSPNSLNKRSKIDISAAGRLAVATAIRSFVSRTNPFVAALLAAPSRSGRGWSFANETA
jgi:hypothetical protein